MNSGMPSDPPTHARFTVLRLIFLLAIITYLDRLCISSAAPAITREFSFSPSQMGWIFSAFTLAYAIFEIPGGWLGDRFGTRLALTRIVCWWSAFTMLTGAVTGFRSLLIVRFLFGAGEAGAFPNIARSVALWLPKAEHGRGLSVSFIGLAVGSALSSPLVFSLIDWQGWRWTFVEFGLLGVVWAGVWYRWFRDRPEDHPAVNEAELQLISADLPLIQNVREGSHQIPWQSLLTSGNLALICAMYFAYGYGLYFYLTWLPTYLINARGFSTDQAKWLSSLPWVLSAGSFWFGGWLTDRLARAGKMKLARSGPGAFGYAASALVVLMAARIESPISAALLLAFALVCQTMTISAAWAVCLDVGRKNAGIVTGFMNTAGNIGGAIAPLAFGYAVEQWQSWTIPFYVMAGVFGFGAVMWLLVDPEKKLTAARVTVKAD